MKNARVKLTFPDELVREPVLAQLVRRFDVEPNIRRADVGESQGWIVCELDGTEEAVAAAISWLEETGVVVDILAHPLES